MNKEPKFVSYWEALDFFKICDVTLRNMVISNRISIFRDPHVEFHYHNKYSGLLYDLNSFVPKQKKIKNYYDPRMHKIRKRLGNDPYAPKRYGHDPYGKKKKKIKPIKIEPIKKTVKIEKKEKTNNVRELAWG